MTGVDVGTGRAFLDALLEEVMWRGAIGDQGQAREAVALVLAALAGHLPAADAADVAAGLPLELAPALRDRGHAEPLAPADVDQRLAAAQRISRGVALERVRAVCQALGQTLDGARRLMLARRLPPAWAALLEPAPRAAESGAPPGTVAGHGHTLATGRPGGRAPLAESRPRLEQADSVGAQNPHGDSKLSSAGAPAGVEPLATARPREGAPLATAKDERHDD